MKRVRRLVAVLVLAMGILFSLPALPTAAQATPEPDEGEGLGEIVVTLELYTCDVDSGVPSLDVQESYDPGSFCLSVQDGFPKTPSFTLSQAAPVYATDNEVAFGNVSPNFEYTLEETNAIAEFEGYTFTATDEDTTLWVAYINPRCPGDCPEALEATQTAAAANPPAPTGTPGNEATTTSGTASPQSSDSSNVTPTPAPVIGRRVALFTGDCDQLGTEVAALNDVARETGDPEGDDLATAAELSITTGAQFSLQDAIQNGDALVVYKGHNASSGIIACGELGGVNNHDGSLPIGLQQMNDSGFVGLAVLSYNADDDTTTDVTLLISHQLLK